MKPLVGAWAGALLTAVICIAVDQSTRAPLSGRQTLFFLLLGALAGLSVTAMVIRAMEHPGTRKQPRPRGGDGAR